MHSPPPREVVRKEKEQTTLLARRERADNDLEFLRAKKEMEAAALEEERAELRREYESTTRQRHAEQDLRAWSPPRAAPARSPRRVRGTVVERESVFDRLAARASDAELKQKAASRARKQRRGCRDSPSISDASRRMAGERSYIPVEARLSVQPARPPATAAEPEPTAFKASPAPDFTARHLLDSFESGCQIAMLHGPDVAAAVHNPAAPSPAVATALQSPGMKPGEMAHLKRQLAALRNRGLDEVTLELVEGLFASIDAKSARVAAVAEGPAPHSASPARSPGGRRRRRRRPQQRSPRSPSSLGTPVGGSGGGGGWSSSEEEAAPPERGEPQAHEEQEEEELRFDDTPPPGAASAATPSPARERNDGGGGGSASPSAPFPPTELSAETSHIICHAAKFVALHGEAFYRTLEAKHLHEPDVSRTEILRSGAALLT